MKVQIINKSKHTTPNYETEGAAGMDLRANITESITLKPLSIFYTSSILEILIFEISDSIVVY